MNQENQERERKIIITEVKYLMSQNKVRPFSDVDSLSDETLVEILKEYNLKKLSGINNTILSGVLKAAGAFAVRTETLTEETVNGFTKDFLGDEDVVSSFTFVIGFITPNIPMIGLLTGAVIVSKFLYDGFLKAKKDTAPNTPEPAKSEPGVF